MIDKKTMHLIYYFIVVFFQCALFSHNDYVQERSWQERKQYARKILNLFINK
jgi:hypothetical protein